ncbi:acetyl-CoA synthetase-like protein [Ustulina deusta]|nr:acetyl-CoA synthetase-like protein [Ustulina deusta]
MADHTFHALANGGVLVIAGKEDRGDPVRLAQIMLSENYLAMLNYGLQWLKRCEKLTPQLRRGLQKLELINLQLINAYGPTEGAIACARGVVPYHTKEDVNSLADYLWPMPNYSISIMDEHQHCLPIGFAGEMCIAGPGLCLGYLNRPEETKRAFIDANIPSPSRGQLHPSKLYRTGDRGRLLADGSLQVLGRIKGDGQVKIRGLRVELDEIANVIIQNLSGAISNAAVSYRAESDLLIAFVVFNFDFLGNRTEFVNLLKMELLLPSYMRPSIISILDHIPINVNGKLDRAAVNSLPIPISHLVVNSSTNDLTASEQQVAKIWNELLGSRMASDLSLILESDFFHVGGNSMLAIGLRSALRATFGVEVTLARLFQLSTVRRMALLLQPVSTESANCMDWKAEISEVSRSLSYERRPISAVCQRQSPSVVLLTGATEFLGTQILRCFVANPEVQKIYCIAIRRDSVGNQQHVSIQSNKIVEYAGDLTSRQFGLSDEDFEFLGQQSDLIIYNALLHRIPFYYVSTAGVASIRDQHIPVGDTYDGYILTKWVSECLLEVAALEHNLPVWIHRPTTILGDGAPEQDLMPAIIKYSRIFRAVPRVEELNVKGSLDLVEVEQVLQDLVNAALDSLNSIPEQQVALSFIHHCNAAKISPSELGNYLEQLDGVRYGDLFLHEWVQEALDNELSRLVHDYLYTIMHRGRLIVLPGITRNQPL